LAQVINTADLRHLTRGERFDSHLGRWGITNARMANMITYIRKKLRAAKAAEYLGVSRSTLAKWRINGMGPLYHRCGPRIVYYYQDELDAWQEDCDRRERRQSVEAPPAQPSRT
jgi:hypothetical protein